MGEHADAVTSARLSLAARQIPKELVANLCPRAGGVSVASILGQPVAEQLQVPIWNADLIGRRGDPIPERLDVVEVLINCQVVEARGR